MATVPCYRYDFAPITSSETTKEGYLRVWCRAARTGTQLYRRADGSQVREYRHPEEVGNPDSLSTFGMKPATWGHPPTLLDADNTSKYQVGYSGSQVRYNDGFVEVALVVTDSNSIKRIKSREATQVSAGYAVDFDPTPGITPDGESYDGTQRNIRVNHIAIVPRGRAGPEVRLLMDRMDAADAVAYDQEPTTRTSESALQPIHPASPVMATVNLDGMEIDLPAEAATAVQSYVRDLERQYAAVSAQCEELTTKLDSLQTDFNTLFEDKEAAEGRADALEEQISEFEDGDSARLDTAELDQLVMNRLTVLQHLAPAFAEDFKFDGIDDDSLYFQAYENLTGEPAPEDADPTYVAGLVDGILSHFDAEDDEDEEFDDEDAEEDEEEEYEEDDEEDRGDSVDGLRTALRHAGSPSNNPVASHHSKQLDAWKRPLTATK